MILLHPLSGRPYTFPSLRAALHVRFEVLRAMLEAPLIPGNALHHLLPRVIAGQKGGRSDVHRHMEKDD